jgi:predicted TIM-barrel fold metal-dependent hydrolase
MKPSEYLASGRYFCSVERHEGADMFDVVRRFLGDDVLMYASDYPHSECQFPDTVSNFLKWDMKPETRQKLMAGNAARFFRQA